MDARERWNYLRGLSRPQGPGGGDGLDRHWRSYPSLGHQIEELFTKWFLKYPEVWMELCRICDAAFEEYPIHGQLSNVYSELRKSPVMMSLDKTDGVKLRDLWRGYYARLMNMRLRELHGLEYNWLDTQAMPNYYKPPRRDPLGGPARITVNPKIEEDLLQRLEKLI